MANAFQTATVITNEMVRIIHNTSAFLGNTNSDFDKNWGAGRYAPGSTVYARRPVQFTIRNGSAANVQDLTDSTVPITVNPELGIDFAVQEYDLVTAVQNDGGIDKAFRDRFLKPAALRIAAEVDFQLATLIKNATPNIVGTPGTGMSSVTDLVNAQIPMDNNACPRDAMRYAALNPVANAAIVAGLATLFNPRNTLDDQYKKGVVQTQLGIDLMMSQNVPTHTVGALGGTPLVNGVNQGTINAGGTDNPYSSTTSLVTNGWTAAATQRLNKGDIVTLAGVNAVNPETKQDTGSLMMFVVTANASSDGAGNLTAILSPAIIAGGAYQNVTARPASGAAITVKTGTAATSYAQNILWHRDAVTLVSPEMDIPGGMEYAAKSTLADSGGISLRFVRGFDILNNKRVSRFDVLWGAAVVRPEWCVRRTA